MELKHHEFQNQKFYDLLQSSSSGGQSASATIELIMRTLDQEDLTVTHNIQHQQGFPSNGLINVTPLASNRGGQSGQQIELDPNVVLQTFNLVDQSNNEESSSPSSGMGGVRPHVCQLCQASYKTRTHLRRHMVVHLNNRPYPCLMDGCGKGFNRKEHLTKHIEAVHSGTKYKCKFCSKEISRKDHLSRHIKNMHPNYASPTKDGNVPDPSILKVQLPCGQKQKAQLSFLTPGAPTTSTLPSAIVGQTFITPVTTTAAATSFSQKSVNRKSTNANSNSTANSSGKMQVTHVINTSPPLQIETPTTNESPQHTQIILDSASFQQLTMMPGSIVIPGHGQITTVSVANSSNSIISSSSSGKGKQQTTLTNSNNQNGLLALTNLSITLGGQISEDPLACTENNKRILQVFTCTECPQSFTSEKDLNIHSRSHKPQNYRCSECPRAYTRREKLTEHVRCFHQGQKFQCEYCGKELSRKDHVLRHVRSIHPEVLASRFTTEHQENAGNSNSFNGIENRLQPSTSSNSKASSTMNEMGILLRSICQYCLKVFGTSYHLSRHIESCHSGDLRPYSCASCNKKFKRKDHLTKHIKSHCPSIRDFHRNHPKYNHQQNSSSTTANNTNTQPQPHARKSLPNLHKISKMEMNGVIHAEQKDSKFGKLENETKNTEPQGSRMIKGENPMEENDSSGNEMDIHDHETDDIHLDNLAMINSFIAQNVNVVVEEEDLSSLLQSQHDDNDPLLSHSSPQSPTSNRLDERSDRIAKSSHCGHCQKEFTSTNQLLDHLQEHTAEDLQDPRDSDNDNQELRSIQFANY